MASRKKASTNRKGTDGFSEEMLEDLRKIYYYLKKTRELDVRLKILFRQGKFEGTYFSAIGQEATTVVPTYFLRKDDFIGPAHRELGCHVVKGNSTRMLIAQAFHRANSEDGGHNHPVFWGYREGHILSPCTLMAAQIPVATGAALSFKMRGMDSVAVAFFGEGGASKGEFHESANFAGVHKLPIVYIIQNNFYAESVPIDLQAGNTDLSKRAIGYGMAGARTDGNDVIQVYGVAREAVERARSGGGPSLIQLDTYRWYGHSEIDPANYRPKEEVDDWIENRDPVKNYERFLLDEGIYSEAEMKKITDDILAEIDDAVEFAESSPHPAAEDALRYVYAD